MPWQLRMQTFWIHYWISEKSKHKSELQTKLGKIGENNKILTIW